MMQRDEYMYKQFLRKPPWFKIFISSTLLSTVVLSSRFFSEIGIIRALQN